jgi:hypothetical protein
MPVAKIDRVTPWLLLTLSLPSKRASQRVEVWRKLQRYGAIPLGNSGYLLPNDSTNQERFEWLATAIRKYAGEASVVKVQSIDNISRTQLVERFAEARGREYKELIHELHTLSSVPREKRSTARMSRLRTRFREIVEIDFFNSPQQKRVEKLFNELDTSPTPETMAQVNPRKYVGRVWVTRPRPGIDRSASAWLIRRFIDKKAKFAFSPEEHLPAGAVPFDMFHSGGFGHRGGDCSFETLQRAFRVRDQKARVIGQIIHDADLLDEKFGRKEGFGIDEVLNGWARQGVSDRELLERGIRLIEALYISISKK